MQSLFFMHAEPCPPWPPMMHSPRRVAQLTWQVLPPPHRGMTGSQPGKVAPSSSGVPPSGRLQDGLLKMSTAAVATFPILMTAVVEPMPTVQPVELRRAKLIVTVPERAPVKLTDRSFFVT